jgi:hypothetical protein
MIEQGTPEWRAARMCTITSTRAHALLSSPTTRRTLMAELLVEFATADYKKTPCTPAMERGKRLEPVAVAMYRLATGLEVEPGGYWVSDFDPLLAASPDAWARDTHTNHIRRGLEIKCLDPVNHTKVLLGAPPDKAHVAQCEWCIYVTGTAEWELVHFCPDVAPEMQLHRQPIRLSHARRHEIDSPLAQFADELFANIKRFGLEIAA